METKRHQPRSRFSSRKTISLTGTQTSKAQYRYLRWELGIRSERKPAKIVNGNETPPAPIEVQQPEDDQFDRYPDEQSPVQVLAMGAGDREFKSQQECGNDTKRKDADLNEPDGQPMRAAPALSAGNRR